MMSNQIYQLRKFFIKLFNWEYWPFHVLYIPVYFYWAWLFIKSRSFFFFSTSNPGIRNAGFLMESKKEIYDLIPPQYYPATIMLKAGTQWESVQQQLAASTLQFPFIAKPDIGMKGMQVKLLYSLEDLAVYWQQNQVDFLLQAYVAYENEVGIFYYRMPGEAKGHISGIVGKEFLALVGDGVSTFEQLLQQNDRFLLQLDVLKKQYGLMLQQVPAANSIHTLVPYGNHCRGAKFVDLSAKADDILVQSIDAICQSIPGFYYGRLDVRYRSWEELRHGQELAIIELNGAGSEPTHMYDPRHSVWFAWKEIIRHLNILYRISVINKEKLQLQYMSFKEGMAMLRANSAHVKLIAQEA